MLDEVNSIEFEQSVGPAAYTADVDGDGVSLDGAYAATVFFNVGTVTDGTHTPKLMHSDDGTTFEDCAAEDVNGTLAALTSDTVQSVGYKGMKSHVKAFVTVTGSPGTGGVYSATVVLNHLQRAPAGAYKSPIIA